MQPLATRLIPVRLHPFVTWRRWHPNLIREPLDFPESPPFTSATKPTTNKAQQSHEGSTVHG